MTQLFLSLPLSPRHTFLSSLPSPQSLSPLSNDKAPNFGALSFQCSGLESPGSTWNWEDRVNLA